MNDFFRSKTFKIIAVLLAAVLAFFLRAVYTGGLMPALSHIGGAVATPFGEFFAGIGNGIQDFFQPIFHGRELQKENEDLQKLVDELTRRQADYDELKNQNDLYRRFFSISDSNADYTLEPATVIAHVPDDPSGSFIINIGQSQGITSGMPVITENGLVGIVGRVSERYCRVLTLMDPAVNIGVLDSTTLDTGILTGDAAMSEDNTARLTYLRLQSEAAESELAEFCEKSAKNRVLRAHSYPKKAPSVSDRYLPLSLVKRDRVSTLWNCFFAVWARLPINSFIRNCPKMIPRLHRSCILQGSAMRGKSV